MAGESSSNPAATAASTKDSEKPRKSLDIVLQSVRRAFSLKKKPKSIKEAVTSSETPPPLPEAYAFTTSR